NTYNHPSDDPTNHPVLPTPPPSELVEPEKKAGDGPYISIRGLDSSLNNFKLNGMNVAQAEETSRRIPLDVIQVEAVSQVTVHKTDRKSTRLNSSHVKISYDDFCL